MPGPSEDQAAALERSADGRLARLHLRGGLLPLARAALEQMAGAGTLDRAAMADLAEVRWRNGDLEGAAEAAEAHTASGGDEPISLLILTEEMARQERHTEASALGKGVFDRLGGTIDVLFAGQPRSPGWPPQDDGWMDTEASVPGQWGLLVGGSEVAAATADTWTFAPLSPVDDASAGAQSFPAGRGGIDRAAGPTSTTAVVLSGRLAGEELERVDRSIDSGQTSAAADRLGVLLRLDPALAPVILSAADRATSRARPGDPGLSAIHLVRGDAYRVLGRDNEAAAAYQEAHQTLASGSSSEEPT